MGTSDVNGMTILGLGGSISTLYRLCALCCDCFGWQENPSDLAGTVSYRLEAPIHVSPDLSSLEMESFLSSFCSMMCYREAEHRRSTSFRIRCHARWSPCSSAARLWERGLCSPFSHEGSEVAAPREEDRATGLGSDGTAGRAEGKHDAHHGEARRGNAFNSTEY